MLIQTTLIRTSSYNSLVLEGINANAQQGPTDWEEWLKKLTKGLENLGNDNDKKYDVDEDETDREVQCTDEEYTSQNQNGTTSGKIDSGISGGVGFGCINVGSTFGAEMGTSKETGTTKVSKHTETYTVTRKFHTITCIDGDQYTQCQNAEEHKVSQDCNHYN